MKKQTLCVAVDFDGTCVTHEYPKIGRNRRSRSIEKMEHKGYNIILNTMRSSVELEELVKWFTDREIKLYGS